MIQRLWPLGLAAIVIAVPALAQSQVVPDMFGVTNRPMKKDTPPAAKRQLTGNEAMQMPTSPAGPDPAMQGDIPEPPGMAVLSKSSPVAASSKDNTGSTGTALPAGDAQAPPIPTDHYADRTYPAEANARGRALIMHQQGGQDFYKIMFNLAEYQVSDGRESYRWDGEAWFGGDINRVTLRSEGEATHESVDSAEMQLLYSRAVGPYFNLQGGVRHDIAPTPTRTFLTVGMEGLAPYMFQTEVRAFVAITGQVLGRLEGWYDQRLTQRFVLQPRVELNLAAQNDPPTGTGAGLVDAEMGLRLRYEIAREFAPYIGLSHVAEAGRTAHYSREAGKSANAASFVAGIRFWF